MFNNLFGKKEKTAGGPVFNDLTYISAHAKAMAILNLAGKQQDALFIAWFANTLKDYQELFTKNGLDENRIKDARHLHLAMLNDNIPIFLEHHPMHHKESVLVQNWPGSCITVYNSLEDPLMLQFGGRRIIELMKKMGMKEDEAIKHYLVSKAILNAQEKIASAVITEQPAFSQEEWMRKNWK